MGQENLYQRIKGKIVPVQKIKAYGGGLVSLHSFLTSTLNGAECSASRLSVLTLKKTPVRIKYEAGWVSGPVGHFGE